MRFVTADRATTSNVCHKASNACHPERSLAESEANRQTQSKDPVPAVAVTGNARNFRIMVRCYDERGAELFPDPSRQAAKECSPGRKSGASQNWKQSLIPDRKSWPVWDP